ncbi:hypothetical protein BJ878DRAFT_484140 [Calycina marina]|uniref:Uncharacterized protein n=1 Tax=Calycina marina TaxID=1763456 RepID=A0A9P7YUP4_9HELO|nr:hypothetical protein BJ878DRAFT_484140 [Calycina marina]
MALLSAVIDFVGAVFLTLSILIITSVTSICFTPPTLSSEYLNEFNRNSFASRLLYYCCSAIVALTSTYHAQLIFTYHARLCRSSVRFPANFYSKLFAWNFHTILCIALILISGQIMLLASINSAPPPTFNLPSPKTSSQPAYIAGFNTPPSPPISSYSLLTGQYFKDRMAWLYAGCRKASFIARSLMWSSDRICSHDSCWMLGTG